MIIGSTPMMDSNPFAPAKPESLTDSMIDAEERREFANSEVAAQLRLADVDPEIAFGLDAKPIGVGEMSYADSDLLMDGLWYESSKVVHDNKNKVGNYRALPPDARDNMLSIMAGAADRSGPSNKERNLAETRDATEIAQYGLEHAGSLTHNFTNGLIDWSKIDDMPPEVALAQAALLEMYERTPEVSWNGASRFIKNFISDPTALAGGIGGLNVVTQLLKSGGRTAIRKRLMQVALGASAVGAEGSAYAGMAEYLNQRFKFQPPQDDEVRGMEYPGEERPFQPNWNSIGQAGLVGAGLGATLGVGIGQAGNMVRGARNAFGNAVYGEGATLYSGIPLPANPNSAGTQLAQQPDEMGFRSGLINMLDALPESASGEQILATLSNPERLGEFGAKAEEIVLTGLDKYLSEVDGPVTKQMVADFLQANRVRLDEARDLGGGSYMPGEYNSIDGEVYDFDELISDQGSTSPWVFDRGYVSGYRDEGDDTIDVMITKEFPIDDGFRNNEVLDEVELIIDNESLFYSSDPRSTEEGIAAGVRAKEIIGELRELYGPGASRNNDVAKAEILYSDLEDTLSEVQPGIVFGTMETRADYELYDAADDFYIGAANSADEANHQAARHIESIDNDGEGFGQYSSVTFPTESGEAPANYKEVRLLMPEDDPRFPQTDSNQHFEENTFAHYRSTDRQVVIDQPDQPDMFGGGDPQRVMFVEEIQSDLMQAGGKRGYKTAEVMDTWKAEGTEIQTRMKDKLTAFGYGEIRRTELPFSIALNHQTKDADILTNLTGLYEGFSRMMKGKDRVSAMQKYLDVKLKSNAATYGDLHDETKGIIMAAINSLPNKKVTDDQMYDAFGQFVAAVASLRGGGNEVGGVVRDLSPIRYGYKMVDSDGYDRGLEFLDKLNSKDLYDFYRSRDKAMIAQSGLPDIPLKKDWVELTMKRAIYDAIEEGQTMIAFPNHAETVGAIEYGGKPATGAIKRLYEADIPKLVKKLAKQTGGEVKTGAIANSSKATQSSNEYPNQGSVIVLDLSKNPQKVKREGFAIPVVTGGATALTAAQQMQQQDQQPQQ